MKQKTRYTQTMSTPLSLPKLLYVEDNADARALVRRVLSPDFLVLEAADPLSGIELAQDTEPDLILMDINLPQMSGREAAARLRTLLPATPLVAFSADSTPEARDRSLAAGFSGYIVKPLNIDTFSDELKEFLHGKRETLKDASRYQQDFASELVARLEEKVRELTRTAQRNDFLNEQNRRMIVLLQRRQRLLEAAALVGQMITSILDLDELLGVAPHIICEQYGFLDASIYLVSANAEVAERRAAHTPAETAPSIQIASDHLVAQTIRARAAQVGTASNAASPNLPEEMLGVVEMALPLMVKDDVFGALAVRSSADEPLTEDDRTALQALANQVAIAINNARLLDDLHNANQELLRNKTLQAIATATGEAIHWVGNKAAPIPASARRVREDVLQLAALFQPLLLLTPNERKAHPAWSAAEEVFAELARQQVRLSEPILPLGLESILEDLTIIEQSATTILNIKEDLIGPARLRREERIDLPALLDQTIFQMGLPDGVIQREYPAQLPALTGDARQLGQVFNNLIKNAWEALHGQSAPRIGVRAQVQDDARTVLVEVYDNGPGIPPELVEKIWVSFFTTKGERGGTGLGLSACAAIVSQMDGRITVESKIGEGACFKVFLPVVF
jgi:signal transduction histidine kinase/DNA-binding response OmpR family regulator